MSTFHEVLGVTQDATPEEIKRAFRRLAMRYHPDRNSEPDAAERFDVIKRCYDVLSDPDKRTAYEKSLKPTATHTVMFDGILTARDRKRK